MKHISALDYLPAIGCMLNDPRARLIWRALGVPAPDSDGPIKELLVGLTTKPVCLYNHEDTLFWLANQPKAVQETAEKAKAVACTLNTLSLVAERIKLIRAKLVFKETADFLANNSEPASLEEAQTVARKISQQLLSVTRDYRIQSVPAHDVAQKILTEKTLDGYIRSSMDTFNAIVGGYKRGRLHIIAGRPGRGKTMLATREALAMAQHHPGLFISLEMSTDDICLRMLSMLSQIENDKLHKYRAGQLELTTDEQLRLNEAINAFQSIQPIILTDHCSCLEDIETIIYENQVAHQIAWCVVDYVQLVYVAGLSRSASRREVVAKVSNRLARIAAESKIAMIVTSQLSRRTEDADNIPTMADLKESGDLEQDATTISTLHQVSESIDGKRLIRFEVLKNRDGQCCLYYLVFNPKSAEFTEEHHYGSSDESIVVPAGF